MTDDSCFWHPTSANRGVRNHWSRHFVVDRLLAQNLMDYQELHKPQFFDIAERKCEPGIEPNRVLDDHRRKATPLEGYRRHAATVATPNRRGYSFNLSMSTDGLERPFYEYFP